MNTNRAQEPDRLQGLKWLAAEWAACMVQAVESVTTDRPRITVARDAPGSLPDGSAANRQEPAEEILWQEQAVSLARGASLGIGAPAATWKAIGGRALAAAGLESPSPEDVRGTYLEILQQSFGALARTISSHAGREVACAPLVSNGAAAPSEVALLEFSSGGGSPLPLQFAASGELLAALAPLRSGRPNDGAAGKTPAVSAAPAGTGSPPASMDLLLDVELPVSVSFGRTDLPLKDVLKLSTGSIVELNRGVNEAVEVIVNNCVVARGEVVVVEGNYGVRIQQIISRQERLRTLR